MVQYAALLFSLGSVAVGVFQLALALGAPWGEFTLGGRWQGRLPTRMRLVALFSMVLLGCFSVVILARAELVLPQFHDSSRSLAWAVVAYCALGSLVNAITPSMHERKLWLPVVLCMLVASLVVATS